MRRSLRVGFGVSLLTMSEVELAGAEINFEVSLWRSVNEIPVFEEAIPPLSKLERTGTATSFKIPLLTLLELELAFAVPVLGVLMLPLTKLERAGAVADFEVSLCRSPVLE